MPAAAHRRLPVRGHDPRGGCGCDRSPGRSARHDEPLGLARRADGCSRDPHVADPRRRRRFSVACVPVAFGTADDCLFEFGHLQAGETVLDPGRRRRRRHRGDPAREARGATVIATASSDDRLERLKEFGLDHGVNYARRLGRQGARDHRRARCRSRRRLGRREDPRRQRAVPRVPRARDHRRQRGRDPQPFDAGMLGMNNQSLTGVFLGAEITTPRAQAMIGRLVDDVAAGRLRSRRPHLPARRSRRRPRLPREPPSRRPRRPHPPDPERADES